ncbi:MULTISPECIES: hypothetical protein [Listeria]|uniref:hypothetical protein n=1 Tax=Listeria TaxID=1637 RepID=UPI000B58B4C0|nr:MULTISPECIES: hypothetical protein [Listeria]
MINRKAEFIMSIIGASLAALGVFIMGGFSIIMLFAASVDPVVTRDDFIDMSFGIGFIALSLLLAIAACVFGFIAAFKLKNGVSVKGWSIVLIVIGGISFFSYGFVTGVLFLISGIMSLAKLSSEKNQFDSF